MATFIGIDVSKDKLDICVKNADNNYSHFCINNSKKTIKIFFNSFKDLDILTVAFENTGRYGWYLYDFFADKANDINIYVLHPLDLKRRMGLKRGKNDKIDAQAICEYIELNHSKEKQWAASSQIVEQLKVLVSERVSLVKTRTGVKNKKCDLKLLALIKMDKSMRKLYDIQIKQLTVLIKTIEAQISQLIASDQAIKIKEKLIRSVPGVGVITAFTLIAKTNGFTKFKTARQLACMAGVVPFDNQSGKFKGKSKVSKCADKQLKTILNLAALRVIQMKYNEMGKYYERKVKEGKNKMAVINAIRNKILHRVFAVIKNQKMYKDVLQVS